MICNVCGRDDWVFVRRYNEPDKYERWIGKDFVCRSWWRCLRCGFYKCRHSYDVKDLQQIYTNGYRSKEFRHESLQETFDKVVSLPWGESENKHRVRWFSEHVGAVGHKRTILDIGAGLGVFLYELLNPPWDMWEPRALEPNYDAAMFLTTVLGIPCECRFYDADTSLVKYDVVSCIHTLEHLKDPEIFLQIIRAINLKKGGKLLLEVPDAIEFDYLPTSHDEFNSCHLYFFTPTTLMQLVESVGYKVTDLHRVRTKARDLSRIMLLAGA